LVEFIKKQIEGDYDIVTGTRYQNGGGRYNDIMNIILKFHLKLL